MHVLLVEDNDADARLTLEALRQSIHIPEVDVVHDGVQAMQYLRHEGTYQNVPRPHIVLLDLNLPKKNGREVLSELKADPALADIPVIILSGSKASDDVLKAYDLHANCYIVKPVDLERYMTVVSAVDNFFHSIACLPKYP